MRLLRGAMDQATVFNDDPADQARQFETAGCTWLHVVDLNGAFAGRPVNQDAVRNILASVEMNVQLGGGIRDLAQIEAWLEAGVTRVILGTAAVKNPDLVREACRRHPGRIAVGIDAKNGTVAVEGWAEAQALELIIWMFAKSHIKNYCGRLLDFNGVNGLQLKVLAGWMRNIRLKNRSLVARQTEMPPN